MQALDVASEAAVSDWELVDIEEVMVAWARLAIAVVVEVEVLEERQILQE